MSHGNTGKNKEQLIKEIQLLQETVKRLGQRTVQILDEKHEVFLIAKKRQRLFRQIRVDFFEFIKIVKQKDETEIDTLADEYFERWV